MVSENLIRVSVSGLRSVTGPGIRRCRSKGDIHYKKPLSLEGRPDTPFTSTTPNLHNVIHDYI